jgi:hypothetical protein
MLQQVRRLSIRSASQKPGASGCGMADGAVIGRIRGAGISQLRVGTCEEPARPDDSSQVPHSSPGLHQVRDASWLMLGIYLQPLNSTSALWGS